jgi:UDP-3-O-[3-hydroxymyristoyl] glucosamine N-acyltransferase
LICTLQQLATALDVACVGDPATQVDRIAPLEDAEPASLSFLANSRYRRHLAETRASIVILREEWLPECPCAALLSPNPYLTFAHAAGLLYPQPARPAGVHPSAVVAADARLAESVRVGPLAVIESGARLGERVDIGPGCIIGANCQIGADCRLLPRVTLLAGVVLGERVLIQPGAVLGADGFGFANDAGSWVKVPQLGGVQLGNDVEIGANTCIDRGSLRDTRIHDGVKLDNLIQIAHNVELGEHSAIAACSGIAGSTRIGRHCTLGGATAVLGHLELADGVQVNAQSLVTRSLREPGSYSSSLPAQSNKAWLKNMAQLRRLEQLERRVKQLETRLERHSDTPSEPQRRPGAGEDH